MNGPRVTVLNSHYLLCTRVVLACVNRCFEHVYRSLNRRRFKESIRWMAKSTYTHDLYFVVLLVCYAYRLIVCVSYLVIAEISHLFTTYDWKKRFYTQTHDIWPNNSCSQCMFERLENYHHFMFHFWFSTSKSGTLLLLLLLMVTAENLFKQSHLLVHRMSVTSVGCWVFCLYANNVKAQA